VLLFTGLATVVCIFSVLFGEHKDKEGKPVRDYIGVNPEIHSLFLLFFQVKVNKEQALFQWIPILSIVAIGKIINSKIIIKLQILNILWIIFKMPYLFIIFLPVELHFFGLKELYAEYAGIILVSFGFLISLITCRLIICSLTHMKFPTFHFEVLPYYALYFTITKFFPEIMNLQNQFIGMCAVTLFTLFSIFYYTSSVIE